MDYWLPIIVLFGAFFSQLKIYLKYFWNPLLPLQLSCY